MAEDHHADTSPELLAGSHRQVWRRVLDLAVRRPVLTVVVIALGVRLLVAVSSFLIGERGQVPDERLYLAVVRGVSEGLGADSYQPGYGQQAYDAWWPFFAPLARIAQVFGPSRLPAQLFVVLFGVGASALTAVLARRVLPPAGALAAGLLVAVLPSQVLWSSVVLREAQVWTALVLIALCVAVASRPRPAYLVVAGLGATAGLLTLGYLRPQTLIAAAWALPVAVLIAPGARRAVRSVGALALALFVPMIVGLGVGGFDLVRAAAPVLGQTRTYLALDSDSGLVPATGTTGESVPATSGAAETGDGRLGAPGIASRRVPHSGAKSALIDSNGQVLAFDDSASASVRHIPTGVVASLFRPAVVESVSSRAARAASIENLAWYAIYVLALVGLWRCGWAVRRVLAFPLLFTLLVVGQLALTQGNLGTAFRHRGQLLWVVAIFATLAIWKASPSEEEPQASLSAGGRDLGS